MCVNLCLNSRLFNYLQKGQEGREKFGYKDGRQNPFSSKTNREKRKNKNFMMIKHKVRGKSKRSFKDKQSGAPNMYQFSLLGRRPNNGIRGVRS